MGARVPIERIGMPGDADFPDPTGMPAAAGRHAAHAARYAGRGNSGDSAAVTD